MESKIIPCLSLVVGVFALSTSAIFVKLANAPSSITAFYRLFFAALMLLPFLALKKEKRQELFSLTKRQWKLGLLSGLFLAAHYVLWFESLNYTSVASSTVIVSLQPLFSFVGGYFIFKERFSKGMVAGSFLAIFGCAIIGWGDFQISSQALLGDFLAFIAAGIITAYFFIGQHLRKKLSVLSYSILGYASSAFFLALYSFCQGESFAGYSLCTWKYFVGLALFATIIGQMIFNWLLKWLSASVIAMSILGEPIGTCILANYILGELITWRQGAGIVIILIGLALFLLVKNKAQTQQGNRLAV